MFQQYVSKILFITTVIFKRAGTARLVFLSAVLSTILFYLLFKNKCKDCVPPIGYMRDSMLKGLHLGFTDVEKKPTSDHNNTRLDGTIVLAHTESEDVSWLKEYFPQWQHAIYNVELNQSTPTNGGELKVPQNKGHEAMAYLTYIIDHYDTLPEIMLFIHAHRDGFRKAWHVDAPLNDQVIELSTLNLDIIREQGYHNLRCSGSPGCREERLDFVKKDMWNGVFRYTSTPPAWLALQSRTIEPVAKTKNLIDPELESFFIEDVPKIETPCCAQFGVVREVIHKRPRSDYLAFRKWLLETHLDDADSGTVFEYLWHIIFGETAWNCLDRDICYCALYGRC